MKPNSIARPRSIPPMRRALSIGSRLRCSGATFGGACRCFAVGLGAFLFASVLALLPPSVEATQIPCPEGWDISGNWGLIQSNQTAPSSISILGSSGISRVGGKLPEEGISGDASYPGMKGRVNGKVAGFNVHLEISWNNNLTGIYDGKIRPGGKIEGTGYEKGSPSRKVSWYSDRAMICRPPPPAPTPDPIQPGKFVIVHCLGNLIQVPNYRPPIVDDVVLGDKYQVKGRRGGYVTIRTPLGKHNKQYDVPESCVTIAPN